MPTLQMTLSEEELKRFKVLAIDARLPIGKWALSTLKGATASWQAGDSQDRAAQSFARNTRGASGKGNKKQERVKELEITDDDIPEEAGGSRVASGVKHAAGCGCYVCKPPKGDKK